MADIRKDGTVTPPGVAYGYCRVSTKDQEEKGFGMDVQEKAIKNYYDYKLAGEGYAWGDFFRDPRISGGSELRLRPAGKVLWERLRPGDAIDRTLNPSQIPSDPGFGQFTNGTANPIFTLRDHAFFIHTLTFGTEFYW